MNARKGLLTMIGAVCCAAASGADAPVATPDDLGGPRFTPLGAERAGNEAGTIPAWEGGIREVPASYDPSRHETDPFPEDEVLYTITAANMAAHAAVLSDGQQALLSAYPETWEINVYPTRRSASYPEWVYANVVKNATRSRLVTEGKGGVEGGRVSSPFPIPSRGVEVIWNHNLRWRGIRVKRSTGQAAVTRRGNFTLISGDADVGFPYGVEEETPFTRRYPNLMVAFKSRVTGPALLSGTAGLTIEPINQTRDPRKSWLYSRALRRVVRRPFFGYGLPAPNSDNLRTVDQFELYNGAPDRFEWSLQGKRELLIPYNAYRLHSSNVAYGDILRTGHINPDLARFELHRVWVVEGRLKTDAQHIYSRRVFYVDEDSWQIAMSDSYDAEGNLWRTSHAHAVNYYTVPVHLSTMNVFHDLQASRYFVDDLDNGRQPWRFFEGADPREFSPNALLYYVR
jgi:hypothetical protein